MSNLDALRQQLAQMRLNNAPRTLSRIEALPAELRLQILRYLLHTRHARLDQPQRRYTQEEPIGEFFPVKVFDWNVAVLRTCRTLWADGMQILYNENKWVKVTVSHEDGEVLDTALSWTAAYDVHLLFPQSRVLNSIRNHVMEVSMKLESANAPPRLWPAERAFLVAAEHLASFCEYLSVYNISNAMPWIKLHIYMPLELSKHVQRRLLTPFACIRGNDHIMDVAIQGQVKEGIAKKIKLKMTQPVDWGRARVWEMLDILFKIKCEADAAYVAQDFIGCWMKVQQCVGILTFLNAPQLQIRDLDAKCNAIRMIVEVSLLVLESFCTIHRKANPTSQMELPPLSELPSFFNLLDDFLSPEEKSQWGLSLSLAYLKRMQLSSANLAYQFALPFTSEDVIAALASALGYNGVVSSFSQFMSMEKATQDVTLKRLAEDLALGTLRIKDPTPYLSDVAAAERYMIKTLWPHVTYSDSTNNLIREAVSIRAVYDNTGPGDVLGMFAVSGKGSFSATDLDIMEALLFSRIRAQTRSQRRRARPPRLCQIGRETGLDSSSTLASLTNQAMGHMDAGIPSEDGKHRRVLWVALDASLAGFKSISQDQNVVESLITSWETSDMKPAQRKRIEQAVDDMVRTYNKSVR